MDIEKMVESLKHKVKTEVHEDVLKKVLVFRNHQFRDAFEKEPSRFSEQHIAFVDEMVALLDQVEQFQTIQEDMETVYDREDYDEIMESLEFLHAQFEGMALQQRVAREIREMQTRLPQIRLAEDTKKHNQLNTRMVRLNHSAPKCTKGHPMVVREGPHGFFWGCSRYPDCHSHKRLSPEELSTVEA